MRRQFPTAQWRMNDPFRVDENEGGCSWTATVSRARAHQRARQGHIVAASWPAAVASPVPTNPLTHSSDPIDIHLRAATIPNSERKILPLGSTIEARTRDALPNQSQREKMPTPQPSGWPLGHNTWGKISFAEVFPTQRVRASKPEIVTSSAISVVAACAAGSASEMVPGRTPPTVQASAGVHFVKAAAPTMRDRCRKRTLRRAARWQGTRGRAPAPAAARR